MLNWFDLTVLIALAAAFITGMRQGFVMQLAGLASIIAAAIFGGKIAAYILPHLIGTLKISPNIAGVLSYVVAFVLISVVISFIGKALHGLLKAAQLNFVNRIAGGLIAMGTMMVVLSLLLNMALFLDPEEDVITKKTKVESFFYERVQIVVPAFVPYLSKDLWQQYLPENQEKEGNDSKKEPASISV